MPTKLHPNAHTLQYHSQTPLHSTPLHLHLELRIRWCVRLLAKINAWANEMNAHDENNAHYRYTYCICINMFTFKSGCLIGLFPISYQEQRDTCDLLSFFLSFFLYDYSLIHSSNHATTLTCFHHLSPTTSVMVVTETTVLSQRDLSGGAWVPCPNLCSALDPTVLGWSATHQRHPTPCQ